MFELIFDIPLYNQLDSFGGRDQTPFVIFTENLKTSFDNDINFFDKMLSKMKVKYAYTNYESLKEKNFKDFARTIV